MEYIAGEPLTAYRDNRKLPLAERPRLMIRVCQAVQHAHQKGSSTGILKPSNILVHEEDGRLVPKVIDFESPRRSSRSRTPSGRRHPHPGGVVGTPASASPEQITLGEDDTRRTSTPRGMTLYELLTGRGPFESEGANLYELLFAVPGKDAPPPPAERPGAGRRVPRRRRPRPGGHRPGAHFLAGDLRWIS